MNRGWMLLIVVGMVACAAPNAFAAGTFYVVPGGTGTTGTSWAAAFGSIQDAVNAATAAGGGEVWVKAGSYTSATLDPVVTMASGVALYGGFAGTETDRDDRSWSAHVTTITGDSNNDGTGERRCVTGASNATLDGFAITKGYSATVGGGMYNNAASPAVANCTFTGNRTNTSTTCWGGGMYNSASSPAISHCTFTGNSAFYGGGLCSTSSSSPVISDCTFSGNQSNLNGAGLYNRDSSSVITNCIFSGNSGGQGGALFITGTSSPTIANCAFTNNSTSTYAGGVYNASSQPVTLSNCTFTGNSGQYCGCLYQYNAAPLTVINCTFAKNSATQNSNIMMWGASAAFVNCTITQNTVGSGTGSSIYVNTGQATLKNSILWDEALAATNNTAACTITYSCVAGGYGVAGDMNISGPPSFMDASDTDGDGFDLRILADSPCLDTGTPSGAPAQDIRGAARPAGAGIDMGAYECSTGVRHVKVGGTGNGMSWATAFGSIQDAVNALDSGEVWVAAGTYAPAVNPCVAMKERVALYGGFAGTETERDARAWQTNTTTIDGGGARRCLLGASNTRLDGFTVSNGHVEDASGGGMENGGCSALTVANCTFTNNTATGVTPWVLALGGAMFNASSSVTVDDCTFTGNSASVLYDNGGGGAVFNTSCTVVITGCTFTSNTASGEASLSIDGGALYNAATSGTIANCTFIGNSAVSPFGGAEGGAMANINSSPMIVNCTFAGNTASADLYVYGGAMVCSNSSSQLINCTMTANSATSPNESLGGGLCAIYGSHPVLTNCIVYGNSAGTDGDELFDGYECSTTVSHSCVQGGYSGAANISADPHFVDGTSGGDGFNLHLQSGSPCIDTGTDTSATAPASALDMAGVARPQGLGYDMGAYEYYNVLAAFSATPLSGPVPLPVTFSDASVSSAEPITEWAWDFGDGATSTEQNPAHTYTTAGAHYVTLTIHTASGSGTTTKLNYVNVGRGLVEVATWPSIGALVYPQPLSALTLGGGSASVPGTFDFANPGIVPNAGAFHATLVFTPSDLGSYDPVYGVASLFVPQASSGVSAWPTATGITYGESLSASTLHDGVASAGGAFVFDRPDFKPGAGVYTAAVTFAPADAANYASASNTVDVEVYPAATTVTTPPTATAIALGQRLSASLLLGGQAAAGTTPVAGTFAFAQPLTLPEVSGPHPATVTFTPADAANYLPVDVVVSVLVESGDCPECGETTGPYDAGGNACLVVPGTLPAETSFTWSREDGAPLDVSRFSGIFCRRLQITGLTAADAGTYLCTYDDGANVDVYSVTVVVNQASPVPALPRGGRLLVVVAFLALAFARHYWKHLRA